VSRTTDNAALFLRIHASIVSFMLHRTLIAALLLTLTIANAQPATQPATTQAASQKTQSGVTIIETTPGQPAARNGDLLFVHYTGKLENGKVFDTSIGRPPFRLPLGEGKVIKGWDEGLVGMIVGQKRQLIIPPNLAYGPEGRGADIPPNSTLIFDVELVGLVRLPK
jgi:FKBP-type peptidyl-prolyl cis-trans isomerase FkpA